MDKQNDYEILKNLRKQIFITGYKGGMAHFASCFSCLEMLYALYNKRLLGFDPNNPKWEDRDRFILSKGHAGLALYSVLMNEGLISREMFESYLQPQSRIGGEPCMRDCEWIEATTGSLGHGLAMGLGMAMALKSEKKKSRVFVMLGDGECQEGSVWESAMMASAMKLSNLVVILDSNKIQKMDLVEKTMGAPNWKEKWESFGWQVYETDGHDIEAFSETIKKLDGDAEVPDADETELEAPKIVIANTIKGKGVSIMENNPNWHFKIPVKKELNCFKEELCVTDEELL